VLRPVVWVLNAAANGLVRALGVEPRAEVTRSAKAAAAMAASVALDGQAHFHPRAYCLGLAGKVTERAQAFGAGD